MNLLPNHSPLITGEFYSFTTSCWRIADWRAIQETCREYQQRNCYDSIPKPLLRAVSATISNLFWEQNEPFVLVPVVALNCNESEKLDELYDSGRADERILVHGKIDRDGQIWWHNQDEYPSFYRFEMLGHESESSQQMEIALRHNMSMNLKYKYDGINRVVDDIKSESSSEEVPPLVKIGPGGDYVRVYH